MPRYELFLFLFLLLFLTERWSFNASDIIQCSRESCSTVCSCAVVQCSLVHGTSKANQTGRDPTWLILLIQLIGSGLLDN
ncbi:hypothetical protein EDC96DRAFT_519725, partial [Choanephora cucurbitarum]